MCGINGIFRYDGRIAKETVGKMNDALAHRGPDDSGIYQDRNVVLGHRRLSILDLSSAGRQPMSVAGGALTIVYNGELYNYREIRKALEGDFQFRTYSDTEVVLAAWQKWGLDALPRFNGMFAFAIWDRNKEELHLVRDRLGIKPLYFHKTDDQLVFSSEMRAMLASGQVARKLNQEAFIDYLRYQTVHTPQTILTDVQFLPAGHYIRISEEDVTIAPWWEMTAQRRNIAGDYTPSGLQHKVRDLLCGAVERRMVADVPFGAFLSGGIDSSAVVGLMSQVATHSVKTFSVTFNEEAFSEAKYARIIAEKFKTDHTEIRLTADDFLQALPDALNAMDHPSGDGPNSYIVSKATKEAGITMALSGLGGDELFAGYDIFKRALELEKKKWLLSFPKFARKIGGEALKKIRPGMGSNKTAELLQLDYFDIDHIYPVSRQVLLDASVRKLTGRNALPANQVKHIAGTLAAYETEGYRFPGLSVVSILEMHTYMQHVLLRDTDQMSMASALEVRVPFLDHTLIEFVLNIPDRYKYPHSPKQLLVESLGDLLPDEIVNRPKMGFVLPWKDWLKGDLKPMAETAIKNLGQRGIMLEKPLQELWRKFLEGNPSVSWSRLWPLIVLENWMQKHNIEA